MGENNKNADQTGLLSDAVRQAAEKATPLILRGGGSKSFYGRVPQGRLLDLSKHRGIISYEPTELVITARAGTPLSEIELILAENNQMLAFEPPHFGAGSTLGGVVAAGLSGPRRPWCGSVRDFVLGIKMINGCGEVLSFGGQVIKNVAGYDVSRLMAGSLGTLGVILEVSLKVLPVTEIEVTITRESSREKAIQFFSELAGKPLPITGACYFNNCAYVRLASSEQGVQGARKKIGGEVLGDGKRLWNSVREQTHEFFEDDKPLWRLSVASAAPLVDLENEQFIEWGGALRWIKAEPGDGRFFSIAKKRGGHATLFRHGNRSDDVFQVMPPALMKIHQRLKNKFDPQGILNPGRMYKDF